MPGLNKEIWISELMEQYARKQNFLHLTKNLSAFVDNNKINFAEAGARPGVLVNNTSYPVPVEKRTDSPLEISLKTYDTKASHLPNAELVELSYDKMKSVVQSHTDALEEKEAQDAAQAFAPASNSLHSPVLKTSGDGDNGFAQMTEESILEMAHRFDLMDVTGKRTLVLHPTHFNQLLGNSDILRGQVKANGAVGNIPLVITNIYGFDIVKFRSDLLYNVSSSNPIKLAAGSKPDENKGIASFAFLNNEVGHASGDMTMFETLQDATYKGDLISFQHRFIADRLRGKYTGAIVSVKKS